MVNVPVLNVALVTLDGMDNSVINACQCLDVSMGIATINPLNAYVMMDGKDSTVTNLHVENAFMDSAQNLTFANVIGDFLESIVTNA
jgi:hypothetical protein